MSFLKRNSTSQSVTAQISLLPLKSCLCNLPPAICNVLESSSASVQDVIVELRASPRAQKKEQDAGIPRSLFAGWSGMPSKRAPSSISSRNNQSRQRNTVERELDVSIVEIDTAFARILELEEGQEVLVSIHLNPTVVNAVHIEPATQEDWEIIELHATFLEINLLSQIRALPNPKYLSHGEAISSHPLTLHLSPTSTANILVKSFEPALSSTTAFAKISPNAEVIVAPKTAQQNHEFEEDVKRVTNGAKKSTTGRSSRSARASAAPNSHGYKPYCAYFRVVSREIGLPWFDDVEYVDRGLKLWLDPDLVASRAFRGRSFALVSLPRTTASTNATNAQQDMETTSSSISKRPTRKLVVRVCPWWDAPDHLHAGLSTALCDALDYRERVGGMIRVEAAPPQLAVSSVKALSVYPFAGSSGPKNGIRFGGEQKAGRARLAQDLTKLYVGSSNDGPGILRGPVTDGMILTPPRPYSSPTEWKGGIIRFDPSTKQNPTNDHSVKWISGEKHRFDISIEDEISNPLAQSGDRSTSQSDVTNEPKLVGVESLLDSIVSQLLHSSSILLSGGVGAGKSALCRAVASRLQNQCLVSAKMISCIGLANQETSLWAVKDTLAQLFLSASWGARNGGKSLVILDDLDKICPTETELEVGGDNFRSRQISEIFNTYTTHYASMDSDVVVLATAQNKDTLNSLLIGGHAFRETVALKAPDKNLRRELLQMHAGHPSLEQSRRKGIKSVSKSSDSEESAGSDSDQNSRHASPNHTDGFFFDSKCDLLQLAGEIDGYMPGDIELLVARARSEAIIRDVETNDESVEKSSITIGQADFDKALQNFIPTSLRNVTLQTSTTKFDSIGGLHATRQILVETLQYPTKYAPIFAQCPLRLRSGLLLYGFPGCGKTLLASAVAGECGLNFISVKGPEILNKYIGASEKSVRDLFERAEAAKPCVLFFDEFDSIAPKRGHDSTGVTDRVVNQMLTQMDGAEGLSGVYVLAATSRPDLIDPALLRPGRLDKSILCDMPNETDRKDILLAFSKNVKMSQEVLDIALDEVAKRTKGYSGADLQALIYNAHLEAIHSVINEKPEEVRKPKERKRHKPREPKRTFINFPFESDDDDDDDAVPQQNGVSHSNRDLITRAALAAKLEAIRLERRESRKNNRQRQGVTGTVEEKAEKEVVIEMEHLRKSLKTTKSSITPRERQRLQNIYNQFTVGRSGEMSNGEGSTEVGGRTSLM